MAHSNLLGGEDPPQRSGDDIRTLGPSDTSDTGSDIIGAPSIDADSDTDATGTGEGLPAVPGPLEPEDMTPDQVIEDPTWPEGESEEEDDEAALQRAGKLADDAPDLTVDPDAPEDGSVETP